MNVLAAALLTSLASAPLPAESAVRLVPFQCTGISDVELRPLLKVELRARLIDEPVPASAADFLLVSIACDGDTANIVSVPQAAGSPARRQIRLGSLSPDARPRTLAVAVAELLRGPPPPEAQVASQAMPPAPPSIARADDEVPEIAASAPARLDLIEPAILMPLTAVRRAGVRTRAGSTYVPDGMLLGAPNYYVFAVEPFVELPIGRSAVASFTVPVTGTEGPGVSSWGSLGNLTAALRYASGDGVRFGVGAALSVNVGDVPEAQAMSNLFEIDRYRDATESLRLQADALWRSGKLYLQGEIAVMALADSHVVGALLRPGISGGASLSRATVGAEYLLLADPANHYLSFSNNRVVQALIVGTRWKASDMATLGLSLYLALDQGPNLGAATTFSTAWTF